MRLYVKKNANIIQNYIYSTLNINPPKKKEVTLNIPNVTHTQVNLNLFGSLVQLNPLHFTYLYVYNNTYIILNTSNKRFQFLHLHKLAYMYIPFFFSYNTHTTTHIYYNHITNHMCVRKSMLMLFFSLNSTL